PAGRGRGRDGAGCRGAVGPRPPGALCRRVPGQLPAARSVTVVTEPRSPRTTGVALDALAEPAPAGGWRGLFENPGFVRLWLGQAVSQIGDGLTGLALVVAVYRLTHSASSVAALSILTSLPQIVLGLHAGVLADRWERRRVMI